MKTIPVRKINTSQALPDFLKTFRMRRLHDMISAGDMVQELHRHDFFFILAIDIGKGDHTIDFVHYTVDDHAVFFLRPGQVHQLKLNPGSTGYVLQFSKDFYYLEEKATTELLRKVGHRNHCQLKPEAFKKLYSVLGNMFQEYSDKQEGYTEVIKANLRIFLIELIRQRLNSESMSTTELYEQQRLEEFFDLLENRIATHKQVTEYASMLNLSAYQLNAITKAALGKTCSELINEQITLEAKRYLMATSDQVKEIAHHLGYDDVSYFIRFFKRQTGYSPDAFRHNFR